MLNFPVSGARNFRMLPSISNLCPPGVGVSSEYLQTSPGCPGYKVTSMRISGLNVALGDLFLCYSKALAMWFIRHPLVFWLQNFLLKSVLMPVCKWQPFEARGNWDLWLNVLSLDPLFDLSFNQSLVTEDFSSFKLLYWRHHSISIPISLQIAVA